MDNEIILEPHSGLANRMRVIASGLWLGDMVHKKIKLVWNLNDDLNCPFEELFEPIEDIEIINKKFKYRFLRIVEQENIFKRLTRKYTVAFLMRDYISFDDVGVKKIRAGEIDILDLSNASKTLYFNTCESFGSFSNEFKLFIPIPDIQKKINECCGHFNDSTIGIHIRRTDHAIAVNQSPTELFIHRIQNDLQNDSKINYFLSTDDSHTEKKLKSLFGNKIVTLKKEYSRNSITGIRDAVADLYCLANATKIYGSYKSSFSLIASKINGIKLEWIKTE